RELGDRTHHLHRTDRVNDIQVTAFKDQVFQRIDHLPFSLVASIVGDNVKLITGVPHLLLEIQEASGTSADYRDDFVSGWLSRPCDWQDFGGSDSSSYAQDAAEAINRSRMPQRADNVGNLITHAHRVEEPSTFAYTLNDQHYAPTFEVGIDYR